MHVSTKETTNDGKTHTLTSTIEADGPNELVSVDGNLVGEVISLSRTASGGIEVVTQVTVEEVKPKPVEPEPIALPPAEEEVDLPADEDDALLQ